MVKKAIGIIILLSLLILPGVLAEHHAGTNFTVETEAFDSCHRQEGSTFKIIYCVDDIPETMHNGTSFWLRNYFYNLVGFGLPAEAAPALVLISILGVAAIFAFVFPNLAKEYTPIKVLFIISALLLCVVALNYTAEIIMFDQGLVGGTAQDIMTIIYSAYTLVLWVICTTISLVVVYFIWRVFTSDNQRWHSAGQD